MDASFPSGPHRGREADHVRDVSRLLVLGGVDLFSAQNDLRRVAPVQVVGLLYSAPFYQQLRAFRHREPGLELLLPSVTRNRYSMGPV